MRVLPLLRSAVKPFRFLRSRGGNNRRSVRGNVGDWQGLQQLEPRVMLSGGNLIDPDAIGWSSFEDLTATQFAGEVDEQHADYMLVDIEVDEDSGQPVISGVWQDNVEGQFWGHHFNMTSSQFHDQWVQYRDDGYRLLDQESYLLGGQRYYAGIWIENQEGYDWASIRNETDTEFSSRLASYQDDFILIDFEAYPAGGSTLYAGAWVENVDDLQWILHRDLTASEFSDYLDGYQDSYRVHDLESYQVGGSQRYAAIWIENDNDRAWSYEHDLDEQEYQNHWRRYRDMGYRLVDFEEYQSGSDMKYAGVWRQNSDRPDWELRTSIDDIAENHLEDGDIPGLSVAVVHQGDIKYMRGFGHQDIDDNVWYSAHTINRLASVSKAIGGVLLLKLADQGIIDPAAATRDYVPPMPVHHTHTLEQLTANNGGIGHYSELGLGTMTTQYDTALEASELFWDEPLVGVPGASYSYSTHGYTLLGAGIEGATGQSIADVLDTELGSGLGLETLRAENRDEANEYRTSLYNTNNSEATADNISWKLLGGGMEASAYDLARFSGMLMDGEILSQVALEQLWTVPESNTSYAMGWSVGTLQGEFSIRKDGSQKGANTYVRLFPELELGVVVLINRRNSDPADLSRDVANAILTVLPPPNQVPVANAGGDQMVGSGDSVILDGTDSNDDDGDALSYAWVQLSGPPVTLDNASATQPRFVTPHVLNLTDLDFELSVSDGAATSIDTVKVTVGQSGDANFDNLVDIADLGIVGANFNKIKAVWSEGNFNFDTTVDVADLGILGANWSHGSLETVTHDCTLENQLQWAQGVPVFEPQEETQDTQHIDVLVLFPRPAEEHLQTLINLNRTFGQATMEDFLDVTFSYVNDMYLRSDARAHFELVHAQDIDLSYIEEDWKGRLPIVLMNSENNISWYGPYLEAIETLRDEYAADVVIYWRQSGDGGPSANGAGSIGGGEDEAYIHLTQYGINPRIVAHELGHLLGARHEHGYQAVGNFSVDGDQAHEREYQTVMTVAPSLGLGPYTRVWSLSNKDLETQQTMPCGSGYGTVQECVFSPDVPLGDADHDSVSFINQMAPIVAAFRSGQVLVADAGVDQLVGSGRATTLDGSSSTGNDQETMIYQWSQLSGPSVVLSDAAGMQSTFTAPSVSVLTGLEFELLIGNGTSTSTDVAEVTVAPPGDANFDGQINLEDLGVLGANFNQISAQWAQADFSGDGVVNVTDLGIVGANWSASGLGLSLAGYEALKSRAAALHADHGHPDQKSIDLSALLKQDDGSDLAWLVTAHQDLITLSINALRGGGR